MAEFLRLGKEALKEAAGADPEDDEAIDPGTLVVYRQKTSST
jgi:hypothetical protein